MTEFEKELVRFVSGYLDAGVSTKDYVKAFSQRLLDSIGRQSKPKTCEGLEEEISRYLREDCSDDDEPSISEVARHFAKWQREQMMKEAVEGWVAVDSDTAGNRRVTFFPKEPVRDLLTEYKYWAATRPNYESVRLNPNAFPNLKWEDEPIKVRIIIVKED